MHARETKAMNHRRNQANLLFSLIYLFLISQAAGQAGFWPP
jgi:hypothetical protein